VKRTERGKKLLDEKERRVYLNARREQKERNALLLFRERERKKKETKRTHHKSEKRSFRCSPFLFSSRLLRAFIKERRRRTEFKRNSST